MKPIFVALLIFFYVLPAHSLCFSDSSPKSVSFALIMIRNGLDDSCMSALFSSGYSKQEIDSLERALEARLKYTPFSLKLLTDLLTKGELAGDLDRSSRLAGLWEKRNGYHNEVAGKLAESGAYGKADTLFMLFDKAGRLDSYDLLQWAHIQEVLGAVKDACSLYCRICVNNSQLAPVIFNQLTSIVSDASSDTVRQLIDSFCRCYLLSKNADTAMIRNWCADNYGRAGLYDDQIRVIVALDFPHWPSAQKLLDVARERFSKKHYSQTALPANLAYVRLAKPELKSIAAALLYQSYLETGKKDSALYWLEKADLHSDSRKADAAVLYQSTGHLQKSREIIESLSPSVVRDTLLIRQYLFSDDPANALAVVLHRGAVWDRSEREAALWKARTLLYSANKDELTAMFDSINIQPSWDSAEELLRIRYLLQRFGDENMFKLWAKIEYDLFIGRTQHAAQLIAGKFADATTGSILALRVAKVFIENGDAKGALSVLSYYDNENSAEYMYYNAESLFLSGDSERSFRTLQKLLLNYPGDIFSSKARILISHVHPKM